MKKLKTHKQLLTGLINSCEPMELMLLVLTMKKMVKKIRKDIEDDATEFETLSSNPQMMVALCNKIDENLND